MLRKILIVLGLLVAAIPYLGFPQAWDTVLFTAIGFSIMLLVFMSRRSSRRREGEELSVQDERETASEEEAPRALHVEHTEVEERPNVHIERETMVDTACVAESPDTETTIEQQVTVTRRRRKKPSADDSGGFPGVRQ